MGLIFRGARTTASTNTNDLGAFRLNRLTFEWRGKGELSLTSSEGSELQFAGASPRIDLDGPGPVRIASGSLLDSSTGGLTVGGGGAGTLVWSGNIREGTSPQSIRIAADRGIVHLEGDNTFSGGVILSQGTLVAAHDNALGTGTLQVTGGALRLQNAVEIGNAISLSETLVVRGIGTNAGGSTLSGLISGTNSSAGLALRTGSGLLRIAGETAYTGLTTVGGGAFPSEFNTSSSLLLADQGALSGTSGIVLSAGGGLTIEASVQVNRIGDSTPIRMNSGRLGLTGIEKATSEKVGVLTTSGYSSINLNQANGTVGTSLEASEFLRANRGTAIVRGVAGANTRFVLETAPTMAGGAGTGPLTSIVPWAIGDSSSSGGGSNLVTYSGPTGLRPLALNEYATIATATAQSNVRLSSAAALGSVEIINSLVLAGGSLTGGGTLKISSGTILAATSGSIAPGLSFGNVEANIFAVGDLTLNGGLSGTDGLTKSGPGTLTIGASNLISGPLTINDGWISFANATRLGNDASPITMAGKGTGLRYTGTTVHSLARDLYLADGMSEIAHSSNSGSSVKFTITGAISGPGGLRLSAGSSAQRTFELSGANTYVGPTRVSGTAHVIVASDAAFGNGGALELASSGVLSLAGDWETARTVVLTGAGNLPLTSRINTGAFDAILTGAVLGSATLIKTGVGELGFQGESTFNGPVRTEQGAVKLSDEGTIRTSSWTFLAGTELSVDNSIKARNNRIDEGAVLNLDGSRIALASHDQINTTESWNSLRLTGMNEITLRGGDSAGIVLQVGTIGANGLETTLLIQGDNLGGGGTGGGWTRLVPRGISLTFGGASGMDYVPGVYLKDPDSELPAGFIVNDQTIDALGQVGLRGVRLDEFATGILSNPANGGSTSTASHVLVSAPVAASGTENIVRTVTLAPGGVMTLESGQTLKVESGSLFARAGGTGTITGGTLDLGQFHGQVYTIGNLQIGSATTGDGTLVKLGAGDLIFSEAAGHAHTEVKNGTIRLSGSGALENVVTLRAGGVLIAESSTASIGALLGSGSVVVPANSQLTIGTAGEQTTFGGVITGGQLVGGVISGPGRVVIEGGPFGDGLRKLFGVNTFSGGLALKSGHLEIGHAQALGAGPVTMMGGSLRTTTELAVSNAFDIPDTFRFDSGSSLTLLPTGAVSGSGDIEVRGSGHLTLQVASTHSGETRSGSLQNPHIASGNITLSGASGSIAQSSLLRMTAGSQLILDNTTAPSGLADGRIRDTALVELTSAELQLTGNGQVAVEETTGILRGTAFSTITIAPNGAGVSTTLTSAGLERNGRGTFLFRMGGGEMSQMHFASAPSGLVGGGGAGQDVSILPYAVGDRLIGGSGSDLLTYQSGIGLRPLTASEYAGSVGTPTQTSNVLLQSNTVGSGSITLNALVLGDVAYSNPGTTQLTSGMLLKRGDGTASVSGPIAFGTAEANIFVTGDSSSALQISGVLSGSNGLTKSGVGTLALSGANTFSGPLTINAGLLEFANLQSLGTDPGPIVMHGAEAAHNLRYTGSAPTALTRSLHVASGIADVSTSGMLTLAGGITGPGGVRVTSVNPTDQWVNLTGLNSYAGPTVVNGKLAFGSDAALGANTHLMLMSGTLRLTAPWTTNRTIQTVSSGTIDTDGYDATLAGSVVSLNAGFGALTKAGLGTLTLTAASPFSGLLHVNGGAMKLTQAASVGATLLTLLKGELVLDNTSVPVSGRLGALTETRAVGGGFTLLGHATESVSENLRTLLPAQNLTTFTLTAPGTATTALRIGSAAGGQGTLIFRGNHLGKLATDGGATRVRFDNVPPLQGGLLRNVLVDDSLSGSGNSFAKYDTTFDTEGVLGVRALRPEEYLTGATIRTAANGGTAGDDSNYLLNSTTDVVGNVTKVNTITFADAAVLQLGGSQALDLTDGMALLAQRGANATIEGGIIRYGRSGLVNPLLMYGEGDLTFSGTVLQNTPDIGNQPLHKLGSGNLTFRNATLFNDLRVRSGTVRTEDNSLFHGEIELEEEATLEVASSITRIGSIEGTGTISLGDRTLSVGGSSGFAGDILGTGVFKVSQFSLESPVAFAGTLAVGRDPSLDFNTQGVGSPHFSFTKEGSALAARDIALGASGTFAVEAREGVQRIGAVPVVINGGGFAFLSGLQGGLSKLTLGTVSARGVSSLSAQQLSNGVGAHLDVAALERVERGVFRISLDPLLPYTSRSQITVADGFTSALVGAGTSAKNQPILPYGFFSKAEWSAPSLLTQRDALGLRPLDPVTEYSYELSTGDNVWLHGNHSTPADGVRVNSLTLDGTITGAGEVRPESGVILGTGTIASPVGFGSMEAIIYPNALSIAGAITGTAGLTVANANGSSASVSVELSGQNSFTGPLTLNDASIRFFSAGNLGADQTQIVSNDGGLTYGGAQALTLSRPLLSSGFQAALATDGLGQLTVDAPISGPGGLRIRGNVALTGENTYAGYTLVEGRLTIDSDSALGTGPLRIGRPPFGSQTGTLILAGDWVSDRKVQIGYAAGDAMRIDTGEFDAMINGELTQDQGQTAPLLEKHGKGTLHLSNAGGYLGGLDVLAGTVAIDGTLAPGAVLNVLAQGRLTGIGNINRGISIEGVLDPGLSVSGVLNTGSLAFAEGATLSLQIASPEDYDHLAVTGTVQLAGNTRLDLDLLFEPSDFFGSFLILQNDGSDLIGGAGRFTIGGQQLDDGDIFTANGKMFQIYYSGGTGNDVVLSAVPEPASALAVAAGFSSLSLARPRRRRKPQ